MHELLSGSFLGSFKQQRETVTQQAFRSLTKVLDNISGGLLLSHQSHRFTCIDIGEIIVLAGSGVLALRRPSERR
jgi:hypothetical protein